LAREDIEKEEWRGAAALVLCDGFGAPAAMTSPPVIDEAAQEYNSSATVRRGLPAERARMHHPAMSGSEALLVPCGSGVFARTRWSLVRRASGDGLVAHNALDELLTIYWYPLYAWARRRGLSPEDAGDGVQGFLGKVCERNLVAQADAERGKLRSWLLKSFSHFLITEHERSHRQKRGGDAAHVHIDWSGAETAYLAEPALTSTPEVLYARTWALSLMEEALEHVATHYAETNRGALFDALLPALESPLPDDTYADVAALLAMTPAALRQASVRLRQRYRRALLDLAAVRLGITSEAQLEDELLTLLGGK
jgi:RNA polymerase sigma-70 factor (ECF subfamily)